VFPHENQNFNRNQVFRCLPQPSGYSRLLNRVAGHPTPATLRRFGAARGTATPFGAASDDTAVAAAMVPSLLQEAAATGSQCGCACLMWQSMQMLVCPKPE